jgi:hypothetical protein
MQVASTPDDEEKDAAAAEAVENGDTNVTADTADPNQAAVANSTPEPAKPAASQSPAPQNKVKRVLMPIEKRPIQLQKNDASQPGAASLPTGTVLPVEQRPRRTQPGQP